MAEPSKLHRAVLGPNQVRAGEFAKREQPGAGDAPADLFQLWVHRLAMINATVAASLGWKLVALPKDREARDVLERAQAVKALDKNTRRELRDGGMDDLRMPASVRKATRYHLDDAVELESHPAIDLLQGANPWQDGYGLLEATYADLQLFSEAYWFNARGKRTGRPTELWRMMPDHMTPIPDPSTFVAGFEYRTGGGKVERFDSADVVWFRRYSPDNPYRGTGELAAWHTYAKSAGHMAEFNKWLFERNGTPDHMVVTPHPVSEPDKRAFRAGWRKMFGQLFRRQETVAFLTGDVKLERLGDAPKELEFSESSRLVRDFLCAGFGVPKALITPEDANRAVTREANDQHLRLTVWPMACRLFDTLNEQLLPRFGGRLLLVPDNPIKSDAATRVAERASKLASGYTVNEVRREDGSEPLPDKAADIPLVSAGMTTLDRVVDPPAPPSPFAGFGGPGPQDDDDDDGPPESQQEDDGDQDAAEAPREQRAASPPRSRPCTDLDLLGKHDGPVTYLDLLWGVMPSHDLLEAMTKAAVPDDPEEVRRFARSAITAMRSMRAMLLEVADTLDAPEQAAAAMTQNGAEIVRALTGELNSGMASVVTANGQATLNGLRPGIGLAFNTTNPIVVDFIQDSAARIADTVATSFPQQTVRQLQEMIRQGKNPAAAARQLATTNDTEVWMARRLARTEARYASAFAQQEGMAQSGVVEAKQFRLSSNPCDICRAADDQMAKLNPSRQFAVREPMFPNGLEVPLPPAKDGRPRAPFVMNYLPGGAPGPPIHPNCRCTMRAVL